MISQKRWLLIDDVRTVPGVDRTARTYYEGLKAITLEGPWECIIFDHDLGGGLKETGYDLMCLLEEKPELIPNNIMLITANSAARPKMEVLRQRLMLTKHKG